LSTPTGEYDLAKVAARLPSEQQPEAVVCLVDASWRNMPRNLEVFKCPRVLLVADTHHMRSPLNGMLRYVSSEPFDRVILLYDRHHARFFRAAGIRNLFWIPGLTFPHSDATVREARQTRRIKRIAFVGQAAGFHPRRRRLLAVLAERGLSIERQPLQQLPGLSFYGASLAGFNASLNGDLNLRIFEILASGATLLTDSLAPESGLARLLADGREMIAYDTPEGLAERAAHALAHPEETQAIGAAGTLWFDTHFSEQRRRTYFEQVVFNGSAPDLLAWSEHDQSRVIFNGDTIRLVRSLLAYENIQELHREQESVRVALSPGTSGDVAAMCATLPRISVVSDAGGSEADLAVLSRTEAAAGMTFNAQRLWCWDAQDADFPDLARQFNPPYHLANTKVAIFSRQPEMVASLPRLAKAPDHEKARHVLLYTDDPESGGVAQYNHSILCGLAHAGYRTACMQTSADNTLIEEQRRLGIAHHWIGFHTGREFARTLSDETDALRVFQTNRPDLIVFSDCCPFSNLAAQEVAMRLGIPYVVVIGFVGAYLAKDYAQCLPILEEQFKAARAVVAVSQENLRLLERCFRLAPGRGQVIHYGRPAKYFQPPDPAVRARLCSGHGIPANAVVCLTTARLRALKGFSIQLEAMRQLRGTAAWGKLQFVWAGDGDQRHHLEKEIARLNLKDHVHLLGHRLDAADWYDAADIFVLPSLLEGMPLSIMEAMAKGLPVAASSVSGIPEELADTGQLLPDPALGADKTIRMLAQTLARWAFDPAERTSIGRRGRERALRLFREELMVGRTLTAIEATFAVPATAAPVAIST
jgi:glycosyltransferase involved in cell wall biosynthesis